ncbi:DEAD/DEAH box helicase [Natroniella sulfidigena]|uniref:DEAD/DEAH box helicase n=1 Tax=Natroniella sulfidigena TaxID=723921 RepID=UPI00200A9F15|nr:DEAD/DEAH box helicase [Natroniella sulfidigena]MCK8816038.1 DEAD/DEAH box helicase [Natroniella sulfidigena]
MEQQRPIIYLLADQTKYLLGLSTLPELDAKYYLQQGVIDQDCKLFLLTEELDWGVAEYLYQKITTSQERSGANFDGRLVAGGLFNFFLDFDPLAKVVEDKRAEIVEVLRKFKLVTKVTKEEVAHQEILATSFPRAVEFEQVYQLVAGQKLYYSEIRQLIRGNKLVVSNLSKVLLYLKLIGRLEIVPAIKYRASSITCQRCGSTEVVEIECGYCEGVDYHCQDCLMMGEARLCRSLYLIPAVKNESILKFIEPELEFELTALQQDVSDQLVQFTYQDYQQALVWAVCGAGKTEVTFAVIAELLNQGRQVLFAIPRRDVVVELAERLREAFPEVSIKALYGGSDERYQQAELVIATTHQVLRYYQAFDLIILDEMDAFPYQGSEILKRVLQEARKDEGQVIYMTATPGPEEFAELEEGKSKLIKLSARYHGYPLPEPELLRAELEYDQDQGTVELAQLVLDKLWLSVEGDGAQVFLFVPSRDLVELVVQYLRDQFPEVNGVSWVQGSHSQDQSREEKREGFLAGDYPILVSTTIMERGVTVEKANVLVLFADWDYIFNHQTLIQMAGRSGRSLTYPEGRVWFIGNKISDEMELARDMICELNQDARGKGYLNSVDG